MIAHERTQPAPADRSQSEAARRSAGRGTAERGPEPRVELTDIPEMVAASKVAKRLRVSVDVLLRMSDQKQFARYYVFGRRKKYRLDEVTQSLRTLVPGDPDQWRKTVAAVDAACPVQGSRRRRAVPSPARGSIGRASGVQNAP